jgi:hypothetical protein
MTIFCTVSLLMSTSFPNIWSDRWWFCSNSCQLFSMPPSFRDSVWWPIVASSSFSRPSQNCPYQQKMLHRVSAYLHRLHAPFQQFLLLTGFITEPHHHSFINWLHDNTILLCSIKQECT